MLRGSNDDIIIGYHTQEFRVEGVLDEPIECISKDAWLGRGYYFWVELEFAKYWGEDFKMNTGYYDIYKAEIDTTDFLNTVFNEAHYFKFRKWLEKATNHFIQKNKKVTVKRLHEFLLDNFWHKLGIKGIVYDDMPVNPNHKPNRKYSVVVLSEEKLDKFFYYKKRIQLVSFSIDNISNFALYLEEQN
jgi:hypothetical protein